MIQENSKWVKRNYGCRFYIIYMVVEQEIIEYACARLYFKDDGDSRSSHLRSKYILDIYMRIIWSTLAGINL